MNEFHTPVLLKEVISGLRVEAGKKYIDATVGGGGHAVEIVKLGGKLLGIDLDSEALAYTKKRLRDLEIERSRDRKNENLNLQISSSPSLFRIVHGNFRDIERIAKENGFERVSGVFFDLGVSTHELDTQERGFAYRLREAPLDLRFDQSKGETAAELLQRLATDDLYEIFARFGEEKLAWPIARAISRTRQVRPIRTSGDLGTIVSDVLGNAKERNATLARVFQALRIAVNDELGALHQGLAGATKVLERGGRLAVISFHSLEDRIVKQYMKTFPMKVITKKPITPTPYEMRMNVRARSAKLRIGEMP